MAEKENIKVQPDLLPVVESVAPLLEVKSSEPINSLWLVIFTDLVALMLAFFVLLFSMSTVKLSDWQSLIQSLSETLSPETKKKIPVAKSNFNVESIFKGEASNLDYLISIISETVNGDGLLAQGRIERREDHLVFIMAAKLLFKSNGTELSEVGRQAIFVLGGVLRNIDNEIGVNGHSGTASQVQSGYTSNWEISLALAASVANTLRQSGFPRPITAYGFAASQSTLVKDPLPNEGNGLARRIEIIIRPETGG